MISSTGNTQVKKWSKLVASSSLRSELHACIIEGETMVREALAQSLVQTILLKEDTPFESTPSIDCQRMSEHCFKKISKLASVSVMAVVHLPQWNSDWANYKRILICERLQNPDNLGSLIRSAHAAEFDAVFTSPGSADIYNAKTLRASTGSALRLPCFQLEMDLIFESLQRYHFTSMALAADGELNLFTQKPAGNIALIVGNEGQGISEETATRVNHRASLPLNSEVESLNAAIAASIAMYQVRWGCAE